VGLFEPRCIERAFDRTCFDRRERQENGIRLEPIEVNLRAIVAKVDQNIRAGDSNTGRSRMGSRDPGSGWNIVSVQFGLSLIDGYLTGENALAQRHAE
jgi:hypothetical protein